jgi:prepilin-type N-terminal cleavage/methylation domain-containing protein
MQAHPQRRLSRAGFTLIEMVIVAALLVVLTGSVATVCLRGDQACSETGLQVAVDAKARRSLDRIIAELTCAGAGTLTPNPTSQFGTDTLRFQTADDFVVGAVVWGTQSRIGFEYRTGEVNDGVDNNRNGLIDEGRIVLTRNVGTGNEQRVILCENVCEYLQGENSNGVDDNGNGVIDERGFSIQRLGNVLNVRLSLEGAIPGRSLYVRTLETSVSLRN